MAKQILQQIQTQIITATRQLSMVKAQLQAHETGKRRLELTRQQIQQESSEGGQDVRFWQGVGKMFVVEDQREIEQQLNGKQRELETEIGNLTKKQKVGSRPKAVRSLQL